ncbi:MAG: zinc-ribbon domain-containing protein [Clostridia bacterium]|nr:zinc-ribbon domain-containing protein [Clostridia bacterium]
MSGDFIKSGSPRQNNGRRCPYCGETISEGAEYCGNCGKKTGGSGKAYTPISEKKAFIIRLILGAVAVAAFVLLYFFVLKK